MSRKIILRMIVFLMCYESFGQDTLYFRNGKVETGHVVDIDSVKQLIAFQGEGQTTRVMLFSTLERVGLDSNDSQVQNYFNTRSQLFNDVPMTESDYRDFFLWRDPKHTYGSWMIQFDILSPSSRKSNRFPYNSSIGIGIEYFFSDEISASIMGRFGIDKQSFSKDTIVLNYYYPNPHIPEIENGIEMGARWYPIKQRVLSPYLSPWVSFGKMTYYHSKNFERYIEVEPDIFDDYNFLLLDKRMDNFFEWGGAIGFLMNVTRHFNLSAQFNIGSSNATKRSAEGYRAYNNEGYQRWYAYDNKLREVYVGGDVFLVFRF